MHNIYKILQYAISDSVDNEFCYVLCHVHCTKSIYLQYAICCLKAKVLKFLKLSSSRLHDGDHHSDFTSFYRNETL